MELQAPFAHETCTLPFHPFSTSPLHRPAHITTDTTRYRCEITATKCVPRHQRVTRTVHSVQVRKHGEAHLRSERRGRGASATMYRAPVKIPQGHAPPDCPTTKERSQSTTYMIKVWAPTFEETCYQIMYRKRTDHTRVVAARRRQQRSQRVTDPRPACVNSYSYYVHVAPKAKPQKPAMPQSKGVTWCPGRPLPGAHACKDCPTWRRAQESELPHTPLGTHGHKRQAK